MQHTPGRGLAPIAPAATAKHGFGKLAVVLIASLVASLAALGAVGEADAKVVQGFSQAKFVGGLNGPTAMTLAPDGRMFVAQQGGNLRVVEDGRLLSRPFVSLNVDSRGERGLLGVVLDPDFADNRYVYVYHTVKSPKVHNRVTRFTAFGDRAAAGSRRTILDLDNLSARTNHNGGAMHFGMDGKLYIAVGENAEGSNAQTLRNLKGKMLRINKDGTIPPDNPFYGAAAGKNRAIWARGLRNPFSFAIQPGTSKMFINDVGAKKWEEINRGARGANYGWPRYEGQESNPNTQGPLFAYRHGGTATTGCAITGGTFYAPDRDQFPQAYVGDYFFADFCNGWIRKRDAGTGRVTPFATTSGGTVDLDVGPAGSLYYLSRGTNSINIIRYRGQ